MVRDDVEGPRRSAVGEVNSMFLRLREFTTDALRYWELRRLVYNLVLATIFMVHFIARWPASKSSLSLNAILGLFILAVIANVAYSAVYIADVFIQVSGFRDSRRTWRWVLLLVGLAFAAVLTHFTSQGMIGRD